MSFLETILHSLVACALWAAIAWTWKSFRGSTTLVKRLKAVGCDKTPNGLAVLAHAETLLPACERKRYAEEWLEALIVADDRGTSDALKFAAGCCMAAARIRGEFLGESAHQKLIALSNGSAGIFGTIVARLRASLRRQNNSSTPTQTQLKTQEVLTEDEPVKAHNADRESNFVLARDREPERTDIERTNRPPQWWIDQMAEINAIKEAHFVKVIDEIRKRDPKALEVHGVLQSDDFWMNYFRSITTPRSRT